MTWQQSDVDTLRAAFIKAASGVAKVRFADGREVTYQSPTQVEGAIKVVQAALAMAERAQSGLTRRRYGAFRSGT